MWLAVGWLLLGVVPLFLAVFTASLVWRIDLPRVLSLVLGVYMPVAWWLLRPSPLLRNDLLLVGAVLVAGLLAVYIYWFEYIGPPGYSDILRRLPADQIALTFDDGPSPEWTEAIAAMLERHDVEGTFFCLGGWVAEHGPVVRRLVRGGHAVGDHSYSHARLPLLSRSTLDAEFAAAAAAWHHIGMEAPRLYRPPWGFYHWGVMERLRQEQRRVVLWSFSFQDWRGLSAAALIQRGQKVRGGDILLLHDGSPSGTRSAKATLEALDVLIPQWKARGLKLVNLSGC